MLPASYAPRFAALLLCCASLVGLPARALAPVAVAGSASPQPGADAAAGADDTADMLVLGRVSDNPKVDYEKLKPLLDYVVARMADLGISGGRVLMARDPQQMVSYLRRGKVDWVTETAGAAMTLQDRAQAELLLASERAGTNAYQSVMFVRKDSGIRTLEDLRGRSIAFQSASSTSAYFLPASELLSAGLPLVILASPSDRPAPGLVGFVFARSELNISAWVHKGLIDAGAFSDQDWRDLERLPAAFRDDLAVIHSTAFVPRALELTRAGLQARVRDRLRALLLAAARDPDARSALDAYYATTGFAEINEPMQQALAELRHGVARIRAEVE